MPDRQKMTFEEIRDALNEAEGSFNCDDCKEVVDWLTTVQLKTAELQATMMTRIVNR